MKAHQSTVLHHRHLQTTSYNHLLLLHHLISRKEKPMQQQARNPLSRGGGRGLRSQKGLRPFNPLQNQAQINVTDNAIIIPLDILRYQNILRINLTSDYAFRQSSDNQGRTVWYLIGGLFSMVGSIMFKAVSTSRMPFAMQCNCENIVEKTFHPIKMTLRV